MKTARNRSESGGGLEKVITPQKTDLPKCMPLGRGRFLDFETGGLVMGIINCTPDSFFPGSRYFTAKAALLAARKMVSSGAAILDIGGESSRPGSDFVDEAEETARVIPVIEKIRRE
ncbi:MAG: dihydropteroate synthase, partial [Spirochaetota bacterium]